jgi:hypothetical protein
MRRLVAAAAAVLMTAGTAAIAEPGGAPDVLPAELPLGPAGLAERRTVRELAPGVTLHEVVRGAVDPDDGFTVSAGFAAAEADALAIEQRVRTAGLTPRREEVVGAGWVVRTGLFTSPTEADALLPRLRSAGLSPRVDATVDDGATTDGPWRVNIIVVDPKRFTGSMRGVLAKDTVFGRETTSGMAARTGALAAVNGGYFTIDGTRDVPGPWLEGVDGDPAGIAVIDGELLSESVGDRPALVLRHDDGRGEVRRLATELELTGPLGTRHQVTGLNRVPGLVVNCGGVGQPPAHDYTCGNPDELIVFTDDFGATLPAGPGVQASLDAHGSVVEVADTRGGAQPTAGRQVVQGTGEAAEWLRRNAIVGTRLDLRERVVDTDTGAPLALRPDTSVINGGPLLVDDGEIASDPARDGWSPLPVAGSARAEFFWRWYLRRNPRTAAGVLPDGRTVLVQSDGRAPGWSAGLTIDETARVLDSLGVDDAINLDGGGSSTVVADGRVVNRPSDAAGERPAGDAIVITPLRVRELW